MLQVEEAAPYTLRSEPLLEGDAGTAQTICRIRQLVDQGVRDPFINHAAGTILRGMRVEPWDEWGEARALHAWVQRSIRFTKDPHGKETLRPARTIMEWGFGDCDDINAILLPSLLGTIGYSTRLVTIASNPGAPDVFSHVYCEVKLDGRWIPLDAARKGARFGEEPKRQFRKRVWSLVSDEYQDVKGLAGCCPDPLVKPRIRLSSRFLGNHVRMGNHVRLGRVYTSEGLGFDWSEFGKVFSAGVQSVPSFIQAFKTPPQIVFPSQPTYPTPRTPPFAADEIARQQARVAAELRAGAGDAIGDWLQNETLGIKNLWIVIGVGAYLVLRRK